MLRDVPCMGIKDIVSYETDCGHILSWRQLVRYVYTQHVYTISVSHVHVHGAPELHSAFVTQIPDLMKKKKVVFL